LIIYVTKIIKKSIIALTVGQNSLPERQFCAVFRICFCTDNVCRHPESFFVPAFGIYIPADRTYIPWNGTYVPADGI
jgi:hypothetical protein